MTISRSDLALLDATDPIAPFRDEFHLRVGLIYLDGNSLGALPRVSAARVSKTIESEWGEGLITSWLGAEWVSAPQRIGDKIAGLLGAEPGEIVAADSTSVNLFKALTAALSLRADRSVILSERSNFPTDVYMMQGIEAFSGGRVRSVTVDPDDVIDRIADDVAVLLLTQVHYKTGQVRNMAEVTAQAHAKGALVVWDLSHSAGAIEVDLNGAEADFAVGCGYKFFNGGPGAPAFLFAARRHQSATPVLSGWFGHARPLAFEENYDPAAGVTRFLCGTPPVIGSRPSNSLWIGSSASRSASLPSGWPHAIAKTRCAIRSPTPCVTRADARASGTVAVSAASRPTRRSAAWSKIAPPSELAWG